MKKYIVLLAATLALPAIADINIPMNLVSAQGVEKTIGTVTASETEYGVVLTPDLNSLTPGLHGFHVHQNPSCDAKQKNGKWVAGLAAGGHYDPHGTKKHAASWGDGHLGDLPALYVDHHGYANQAVLAPRLKLADLKGRSLMIHAGGDNHSDHPKKLGGGGARMACGVSS
ncbi:MULTISPECIES: superoxide dismutase [Cu-Zn] SodC [unclassified Endozoicomonas]|uniref:superoxide dismutase [Cu-Zn] SodC n=1 Tax=unclassified Endozoicomonas TaxID=2644528 RepID=UPI002147C5A9|nr:MULTISPECIES: superoxide dismutase [Cu-Zn] SodC [unclassified Endozoicomonas]